MHIVRESDVHRIDFATREQLIDFIVIAEPLDAVASAKRLELLLLAGHKGCQDAVAARMLECRQHSRLGNVTQSNDGITHGLLCGPDGAAQSGSTSSHIQPLKSQVFRAGIYSTLSTTLKRALPLSIRS